MQIKKHNSNFYNSNALKYHNHTINDVNLTLDLLNNLYPLFLQYNNFKFKDIAFIGSGSGRDVKVFNSLGFNCDGYDISSEAIKIAKEYCKNINSNFYVSDLVEGLSTSKKYNSFYCESAFTHVSPLNLNKSIINLKNILEPSYMGLLGFKIINNNSIETKNYENLIYSEIFENIYTKKDRVIYAYDKNSLINTISGNFTIKHISMNNHWLKNNYFWCNFFVENK